MSEEAVKIAEQMLKSDENYLENVIELWRIGSDIHGQVWDSEFHIFGLVASETDHLPLKHVRPNCSVEYLAKVDKELSKTIDYYRNDVVTACNQIIKQLKNV